jgi:putative transposase
MAKSGHQARAGVSYVILATRLRRPVFEISRVAEDFVQTLLYYRLQGHYKLHAYVVVPDHVHLLLTPQGITLPQAMALIMEGFAHRLGLELPVWEEGFKNFPVANMHDLEIVRAHMHQLPVRAELAATAELYPYSSAFRHAALESAPAAMKPVVTAPDIVSVPRRKQA